MITIAKTGQEKFQLSPAEMRIIQNYRALSGEGRRFIGNLSETIAQREARERRQTPAILRLIAGGAA